MIRETGPGACGECCGTGYTTGIYGNDGGLPDSAFNCKKCFGTGKTTAARVTPTHVLNAFVASGDTQTIILATEVIALRAALLRAHCDLRSFEVPGRGSVALAENAALGFDASWENFVLVR